jgi:hypothetical protein
LGQITRSIAVEDECHVMHLLRGNILHIYILVHLKDVHADARDYVRLCFHRWKEKLLRSKADNENCNDGDDVMYAHERGLWLTVKPALAPQPMEENIMLIVSDETHDRTIAESVRPSSETTQTTARSGEIVESVAGRACTKVPDIDVSWPEPALAVEI